MACVAFGLEKNAASPTACYYFPAIPAWRAKAALLTWRTDELSYLAMNGETMRARASVRGLRGELARYKASTNIRAPLATAFPPQIIFASGDRASTSCEVSAMTEVRRNGTSEAAQGMTISGTEAVKKIMVARWQRWL